MNETVQTNGSGARLKKSLDDVVNAAESLMRATVDEANAEYHDARSTLATKISAAKSQIAERTEETISSAKEIGVKGDRFVRANPWGAIGIGAGAGLLLGLLLRKH